MESKLKKKEIGKVGGMCMAIKGRKSIAFKLERKSIKDSASWVEKPKGIEAELSA